MAGKVLLEVVTPEKMVVQEEVDIVMAPGVLGEFGVLPGHTPFLTTVKPGEVRYRIGGNAYYVAITDGFAEVLDDKVRILVSAAEKAEEIDIERARKAKEEALKQLELAKTEPIDVEQARAALERAQARLKIAEKAR
ncbi:MAG TPA: F0F1 ATP synthase subunit epsilon [Syntrophaceae bacterium]|nr:F0F1 ATP synthase subunit epsilon [Syntrophaceae bacterium]